MIKLLCPMIILLSSFLAYAAQVPKIFISQTVKHPALDLTTKGIIDGLAKEGFVDGKTAMIRISYGNASASLSSQIALKYISQNPDIVVGVGTLASQSFIKYTAQNKLVFSTVTDPKEAGLTKANITGVSNFVPLEKQLTLFKKIQPNLKRLGILYNSGEINSVSIVQKLDELCLNFDITLVKQTITSTNDITQNISKMIRVVDAIFISNDNTALSAIENIINIAKRNAIPLYVSDTDAVELGCIAALGPNQYDVGLQTGKMVAKIVKGADIDKMPVEYPDKVELYLNTRAAKAVGIDIPKEVVDKAHRIY